LVQFSKVRVQTLVQDWTLTSLLTEVGSIISNSLNDQKFMLKWCAKVYKGLIVFRGVVNDCNIQFLPPPPETYRRLMQGSSRKIGNKGTVLITQEGPTAVSTNLACREVWGKLSGDLHSQPIYLSFPLFSFTTFLPFSIDMQHFLLWIRHYVISG